MKYAIDRYVVGTEKEVSANEFDGCGIPNSHKRFFAQNVVKWFSSEKKEEIIQVIFFIKKKQNEHQNAIRE